MHCAICIDDENADHVTVLSCSHRFHTGCLAGMLQWKCPMCRKTLSPDDVYKIWGLQTQSTSFNEHVARSALRVLILRFGAREVVDRLYMVYTMHGRVYFEFCWDGDDTRIKVSFECPPWRMLFSKGNMQDIEVFFEETLRARIESFDVDLAWEEMMFWLEFKRQDE